jgi:hypothetical protein
VVNKIFVSNIRMNSDDAITIRASADAFFLMDCADSNTTQAGLGASPATSQAQPWNNFRISKDQPLLDAYAKRLGVTEVMLPWSIPNVNDFNNTIYISEVGGAVTKITLARDFYTGTELATALQTAIAASAIGAGVITVTYDTARRRFTFNGVAAGRIFSLWYGATAGTARPSAQEYFSKASLARTLGLTLQMLDRPFITPGVGIVGAVTFVQYTAWLDIVSTRIHYDSDGKDGNTSPLQTRDVLCRIFCADEISNYGVDAPGTRPFIIHRQFKTPKMIKVNPEQFLASVDFQVLDEYGNLCFSPAGGGLDIDVYPDFQLTFISSEN